MACDGLIMSVCVYIGLSGHKLHDTLSSVSLISLMILEFWVANTNNNGSLFLFGPMEGIANA